jgi:hypothetical protein
MMLWGEPGLGKKIPSLWTGKERAAIARNRLVADRRLLIGWMMGNYPRVKAERPCGICGEVIGETGKRRHAASCIESILRCYELGNEEELPAMYDVVALD